MTRSTRLKSCLYSFTSPGDQIYRTRAVHHLAWDALDFLFPVSNLSEIYIHLLYEKLLKVEVI